MITTSVSNDKLVSLINDKNVEFNVWLLEPGDRYGLDDCYTADEPMVEFYDARYAMTSQARFCPQGQFVARYYLSTLIESLPDSGKHPGLSLQGDVPRWTLSGYNVVEVIRWAGSYMCRKMRRRTQHERAQGCTAVEAARQAISLAEQAISDGTPLQDDIHEARCQVLEALCGHAHPTETTARLEALLVRLFRHREGVLYD